MTRTEILEKIIVALKNIHISNGYKTDLGRLVHSGLIPSIERNDKASMCIVSALNESVLLNSHSSRCTRVSLIISMLCFIPRERNNPYIKAYDVIDDVQTALASLDSTGLTYASYSLDNDVIIGSAYIPLEIRYTIDYTLKL